MAAVSICIVNECLSCLYGVAKKLEWIGESKATGPVSGRKNE